MKQSSIVAASLIWIGIVMVLRRDYLGAVKRFIDERTGAGAPNGEGQTGPPPINVRGEGPKG